MKPNEIERISHDFIEKLRTDQAARDGMADIYRNHEDETRATDIAMASHVTKTLALDPPFDPDDVPEFVKKTRDIHKDMKLADPGKGFLSGIFVYNSAVFHPRGPGPDPIDPKDPHRKEPNDH